MKKILLLVLLLPLAACQTVYYSAMEQVGVHKRDILVDRVEGAKDAQTDAQEQFRDALEHYRSVISFDGGSLESLYDELQSEYDASKAAADDVSERIQAVENVAEALFEEWSEELEQYQSASLRQKSARQLKNTQQRYKTLLKTMKRAEKRMQPVLLTLNDNVLYLKHNLNARAIGALKGEFSSLRTDIDRLISEMQRSINESDAFIKSMKGS